jgi:hypothetical protein
MSRFRKDSCMPSIVCLRHDLSHLLLVLSLERCLNRLDSLRSFLGAEITILFKLFFLLSDGWHRC